MSNKVLFVGESWIVHETHVKGFDTFTHSYYGTGSDFLIKALESKDFVVDYMPNHVARNEFPYTLEELNAYRAIILSDIGANTLLVPEATFTKGKILPNRVDLIAEYVKNGGGLLMVGGYMTFSGINAVGHWNNTAVQEVLPVEVLSIDDRMEHSEGVTGTIEKDHEVLEGVPTGEWPALLGYNKTILKEDAEQLVSIKGDPLVAVGEYGKGKSAVFTSDCAPHWAPTEFCEWEGYATLFGNIVKWLGN